jgi:hypothetical protein
MNRSRWLDVLVAAVAGGPLVAAAVLTPTAASVQVPGWGALAHLCWIRTWTGFECPFCGMTRSFTALMHGDLSTAFRMHPAGPLLAAAMGATVAWALTVALRGLPAVSDRPGFLKTAAAVALASAGLGLARWFV